MTPEQLRASILQYAMEGKLVKQDPNDEPASELIQKIKSQRTRLAKESKIKKSKKLPLITDDEKPFDIPDNWEWARLNDLSENVQYPFADGPFGSNLKKEHYTDKKEVRIIQLSNIGERGWRDANHRYTTFEHLKDIKRSEVEAGDIVIAKMMPAGRAIIVPQHLEKKFVLSSDAVKFVPNKLLYKDFLYFAINSSVFKSQVDAEVQGITRKRTSLTKVKKYILPLPPLEEQKRIVAKIEKLMPLVDEYAESYNRLQKIDNEFEDKLKQSVLQYAMEGKLVKQNPSDEPASELVKASSMEKSHNESYKIPSSWEWIRLGSGVKFINGRAYKKTELLTDSNLTPVLRVGNLFTNSSWYYSDLKLDEDKYIDNGDLIYAWSASFGPRIWNGGHVIYHYHIWKTVIKKSIDKKFLYYFLSDPHNVLGETKLHGSTMKHVTKTNMEKLPFPLPPLEEQKRIVAKIEKIMNSINNH